MKSHAGAQLVDIPVPLISFLAIFSDGLVEYFGGPVKSAMKSINHVKMRPPFSPRTDVVAVGQTAKDGVNARIISHDQIHQGQFVIVTEPRIDLQGAAVLFSRPGRIALVSVEVAA